MIKETPKYCRECGQELQASDVRADCVILVHHYESGRMTFRLDSPFSETTGLPQMARILQCPSYVRKWHGDNGHDQICSYKENLEYSIIVKLKTA